MTTEILENTTNNQQPIKEHTMLSTTINDAKIKQAIKNFKEVFNDKSQRKKKGRLGEIIPGTLQFEHFVFYHMLKGTDFKKATHSTESEKYQELMKQLKNAAEYEYTLCMIQSLKKVFSSLSEEQIKEIILKRLEE